MVPRESRDALPRCDTSVERGITCRVYSAGYAGRTAEARARWAQADATRAELPRRARHRRIPLPVGVAHLPPRSAPAHWPGAPRRARPRRADSHSQAGVHRRASRGAIAKPIRVAHSTRIDIRARILARRARPVHADARGARLPRSAVCSRVSTPIGVANLSAVADAGRAPWRADVTGTHARRHITRSADVAGGRRAVSQAV